MKCTDVDDGFEKWMSSKVSAIDSSNDFANDALQKLKNASLGRIYLQTFKRFSIVRFLIVFLWKVLFPFYANYIIPFFVNKELVRRRKMINIADKASESTAVFNLLHSETVYTPYPNVIPKSDAGMFICPHDKFIFPDIYVAVLNKGIIFGGSNLVLIDGDIVHHNLYNFSRDYTSEQLHGRVFIARDGSYARWMAHDANPLLVNKAACFVDACAYNYAHWLTEVLPRIAIFCKDERFKDVPIVVNAGLHKNILESLFLVTSGSREIITLPIGRSVVAEKLYFTSCAGYVPFDRKKPLSKVDSQGKFSPASLKIIRQACFFAIESSNEIGCGYENIYLRRNSGVRNIVNASEIEEFFVKHGFVVIEPEKLSFLQQATIFSKAKVVVGATGAAMANIVFCSPEARIYVLISKLAGTSYFYWQNIAASTGGVVSYIFGDLVDCSVNNIHGNFKVDICHLIDNFS